MPPVTLLVAGDQCIEEPSSVFLFTVSLCVRYPRSAERSLLEKHGLAPLKTSGVQLEFGCLLRFLWLFLEIGHPSPEVLRLHPVA